MIFLKHFDTSKQTLFGAGKIYVSRTSKVQDLYPMINERMRWTPGTPLKLFEVRSPLDSQSVVLTCFIGNQTRNDRAYEVKIYIRSERDPGWRCHLFPG
jgi:hypothetical protein